MVEHLKRKVESIRKLVDLRPEDLVVDIGSNEGNDDIREANSPESGVASGTCYGVAADF